MPFRNRIRFHRALYHWHDGAWIEGDTVMRGELVELVATVWTPGTMAWESASGRVLVFRGPEFTPALLDHAPEYTLSATPTEPEHWSLEKTIDTANFEPGTYWAHFLVTNGTAGIGGTMSFTLAAEEP
jgi:hypothetical protein